MNLRYNEDLQPYNTLALEARAQALVAVEDDVGLAAALAWAQQHNLPVTPLGEGSNVVFASDLEVLVLRMATRGIEVLKATSDTVSLRVAAGENWHGLVQWSLGQGYYGLENLALIPGTVGAAPIQNIGAYGVELQSAVLQVHGVLIADGSAITLDRQACEFSYRDSVFKHALRDQIIITSVDLELSLIPKVNISYPALAAVFHARAIAPSPEAVFDAVVSIRKSKLPDPAQVPNAGSFFKNPVLTVQKAAALSDRYPGLPSYPQPDGSVKVPAAWMIDYCGWKGQKRDALGVHPEHALVLVNYANASGRQLLGFANDIAASVTREFGIDLEIEPRVYG